MLHLIKSFKSNNIQIKLELVNCLFSLVMIFSKYDKINKDNVMTSYIIKYLYS